MLKEIIAKEIESTFGANVRKVGASSEARVMGWFHSVPLLIHLLSLDPPRVFESFYPSTLSTSILVDKFNISKLVLFPELNVQNT